MANKAVRNTKQLGMLNPFQIDVRPPIVGNPSSSEVEQAVVYDQPLKRRRGSTNALGIRPAKHRFFSHSILEYIGCTRLPSEPLADIRLTQSHDKAVRFGIGERCQKGAFMRNDTENHC